jgi:hypothetical protein
VIKPLIRNAVALACLGFSLTLAASARDGQPKIVIESFVPAKPFTTNGQPVTFVGTVTNQGTGTLAAGTASARFIPVSGLEYLPGETTPKLPEMAPGARASFTFRAAATDSISQIVASLSLDQPNEATSIRIAPLPRLSRVPAPGGEPLARPWAEADEDRAVIDNQKIRARLTTTTSGVPALFLWTFLQGKWAPAGMVCPLAEVSSGEPGQNAWWEVFRAEDMVAVNGAAASSLTITGSFGLRWRATIDIVLGSGSSSLDVRLRLAGNRRMLVNGVRLAPLTIQGGGDLLTESTVGGKQERRAIWASGVTSGGVWSSELGGSAMRFGDGESITGVEHRVIGGQWISETPNIEMMRGTRMEAACRIFAFSPSATVRDSHKFFLAHEFPSVQPASITKPAPLSQAKAKAKAKTKRHRRRR